MNEIVADTLRRARDLIAVSERWTQGEYARTAEGNCCSPSDEKAVCWCSSGAIVKVVGGYDLAGFAASSFLEKQIKGPSIPDWNDASNRTHAEILAAFDRAIAAAPESAP